ncbi:hypothetical protein LXL04_015974 [Taraxacum kok-saghyz]
METTKEVLTMDNVTCSLTDDDLSEIKENFKMDPTFKVVVPTADQTIKMAPEGFVGIYHQFLKVGLRFPVFGFLKTILSHYNLHIAQLAPNSFRKIICFVMLSRALGIQPNLTLFRHFYVTLNAGDWVSFTRRQGVDEICDNLLSSIKRWKPEFLFVDAGEFSPNMVFGEHKNRAVDHPPELTSAQQLLVDQMVVNPVKWSDPDVLMLGMAGLSTYWAGLRKQPIFMVGGKTVTLLDRLQKRKFTGATEVLEGPISDFLGPSVLDTALEEDSSMDSVNQTESTGDITSVSAKTVHRSHKGDRGAGRPPSHPGRVTKEAFVLKKRSSSSSAGGSVSPESEKSGSAPEEVKDASPTKRRRLVRGGRHVVKTTSASDHFPVSSSSATPPIEVSTHLSPLYECPVSSDASLSTVSVASDVSPTGVIVFPASGLLSTASLTRTVDLPFSPVEKSIMPDPTVTIPPLPQKPVARKAADSAFANALRGAGLGFGQFSSTIVSTPPPLVTSEKQASPTIESAGPGDSCEAILNVPSVPPSSEAAVSETVPYSPVAAKISPAPALQHPYMTNVVGRAPGLGKFTEEEGLDRARSLFTEVIHLANGVMLRQRTRASKLAAQQTEYDRLSESMEITRSTHASLSEEISSLARELQQMELRNQELTMELDGISEKQKESLEARQTIEKQLEEVQRHREADLRRLEELGQQFDSLKALFSEKVSSLDILCNQKEVVLTRQEVELQEQKVQLLGLEDRVKVLTTECSAAKQNSLFYQHISEQHVGDLAWLLKQGVTTSVRSILNSEEFGSLNAAYQAASIQVGLMQACLEMKTKYAVLEGEPLLYSFPQSQENLMDRFSEMTGNEYQLLKMLGAGILEVESLNRYLDNRGSEEVQMAVEGSADACAFGSIRPDTKGSAQLNVGSVSDGGVIVERGDDSGKCAEDEGKMTADKEETAEDDSKVTECENVGDGSDKGDSQIVGSNVLTE